MRLVFAIAAVTTPVSFAAGQSVARPTAIAPAVAAAPSLARAVRTSQPVVVDGRGDDPVWRVAPVTAGFRQYYPREDGAPTVETQFQVAYDDRDLYVLVRAFDAHPDSIMHAVTRRDVNSASDVVGLTIDGYHDRRTGVEFAVNPDGVKKDCAVYADTLFDWSWDAVWDAAARVDSAGWVAEFKIPFSAFRYSTGEAPTFGLAVWRTSYRYYESSIWPLWRISRGGLMSQLGDLVGVERIAPPHALTVAPYTVVTNAPRRRGDGFARDQRAAFGADAQYGLGANLTFDATVHPDFAQVEADPSVLNLTTAETFYPEKRPFFLEGARLYQLDLGCTFASCAGEGLFYSRRVGRAPQLAGAFGDASSPEATPIASAAKLTGRSEHGLTVAVLDAATERVDGVDDHMIEPATNYAVVRAVQEGLGGRTAVGATMTAVNRTLDPAAAALLDRDAYVGALDFLQRFGDSGLGVSGSLTASRIDGTPLSIAVLQREPAHNFQRPDGPHLLDTTRTALSGDAEELTVGRYRGAVKFLASWQRHSAGLEVNDAGFMERSDLQTLSSGASWVMRTPRGAFRLVSASGSWTKQWTAAWLPLGQSANFNVTSLFTSNWSAGAGLGISRLGATFCDQCARGGPGLRQDPSVSPSIMVSGDNRREVVPSLGVTATWTDGGRTHTLSASPSVGFNPSTRLQTSLGAALAVNHDNTQWLANNTDASGATHFTFGHLDQRTLAVTARASYAATANFTIEAYAAPFVSVGNYSGIRELSATPRAAAYDARFAPYLPPAGSSIGFDRRQLRANVVARWEYRPGSTLYVVWTHARDADDPTAVPHALSTEYGRLFALHPDNTISAKLSYWLSR